MAALQKFNSFVEALAEKKHNLGGDTLKVILTNTAPNAGDTVKGDISEIAGGNGYTAGGHTLTIASSSQASGIYRLVANDLTITAAGGSIGPFRWAVVYNDSATNDELVGYIDYGVPVTLPSGEYFKLDTNSAGIITLQ